MKLPICKECCGRLRTLTMSNREYGGQIVPKQTPQGCVLETQTRLIKGTGLSSDDPDVANYTNGNDDMVIEVASTPFYREIFDVSNVCMKGKTCNIYFHTHMGPLAPPSVGDFAAHAVFGNHRQQKENPGLLNTMLVVALEGVFEYNLQPWKLKVMDDVITKSERKHAAEVAQYVRLHPKELAPSVIDDVRSAVFNELLKANEQFERSEVERFKKRYPQEYFSMDGAVYHEQSLWKCKADACHPSYEFPYARRLREDAKFSGEVYAFLSNNVYSRALQQQGYYYRFHPWPTTRGKALVIDVNVKEI